MSSVITCPICGKTVRMPENLAGRQINCPQCGEMLKATDSAAEAAQAKKPKNGATANDDDPKSTWQRHRTKLISAISGGVVLLLVTVLGIVLYVRHQNEERDRLAREKAHQEKLKEISHIDTWDAKHGNHPQIKRNSWRIRPDRHTTAGPCLPQPTTVGMESG